MLSQFDLLKLAQVVFGAKNVQFEIKLGDDSNDWQQLERNVTSKGFLAKVAEEVAKDDGQVQLRISKKAPVLTTTG